MERFGGKVALVTGGGNGMGRECAMALASHGAKVVVADLIAEAAAATVSMIDAAGGTAVAVSGDVSDPASVDGFVGAAVDEFGGLDVVVAAAGIPVAGYRSGIHDPRTAGLDPLAGFVDMPLENWSELLAVNLQGPFLTLQRSVRAMLALGRGGSIVVVTSVAAANPTYSGSVAYTASKAGAAGVVKHVAKLVASAGIRVNAVGPGLIVTNMSQGFMRDEQNRDAVLAAIPLGRAGVTGDIADAVLFLLSERSAYITGETLYVDGGQFTG